LIGATIIREKDSELNMTMKTIHTVKDRRI
jgi:hypothetical protein